jgi:putative ABC transport system permease protein
MFKHLFRLMWNKKRQNFLLISEIFVSFLVIFAVFALITSFWQNYNKKAGFEPENLWVIDWNNQDMTRNSDSLAILYENIHSIVGSKSFVKDVSLVSNNTPYSNSQQMRGLEFHGKRFESINYYQAEDAFLNIVNAQMTGGRWFAKQDQTATRQPIVINETLAQDMFGKEDPVGKIIPAEKGEGRSKEVIGVIGDMKTFGDYHLSGRAMYTRIDTSAFQYITGMMIKVAPGSGAGAEGKLYKALAATIRNSTISISHLPDTRIAKNKETLVPTIIVVIIAGFLIINVALGLFGVLWYNINKRRGEIGLRRAVGASGRSVALQLLAEALILATFALIVGTFFAIQFPLLHLFDTAASVYVIALIFTILFIYALVTVCSLYPGRQAAAIYPAVALHED